jgi:taurine dioxygenase
MSLAFKPDIATRELPLTIEPLTPLIGSEVSGIDLRDELTADTVALLKDALIDRKVLIFNEQEITDEDQIRLSRRFGAITPAHPITNGVTGNPLIKENIVSSRRKQVVRFDDLERQLHRARSYQDASRGWHTDITFVANPNAYTFLRVMQSPPVGGDTLLVDLEAIYAGLSPALQTFLDKLTAVHYREDGFHGVDLPPRADNRSTGAYLAEQPLVRVHPETGRKSLFISPGFIRYIVGLAPVESKAILDLLIGEVIARQDAQVRFRMQRGALLIWDNRSTAHKGPVDQAHFTEDRIIHRTTALTDHAVGPTGFRSRQILGDEFYTLP